MATGPKENRGGARKGSGKKPRAADPDFLAEVKAAADKYAKKKKMTVAELLVDKAYNAETEVQQLQALKLYCSLMLNGNEQAGDEAKRVGPVVLPAKRQDPASVVLEKKTEDKKIANG